MRSLLTAFVAFFFFGCGSAMSPDGHLSARKDDHDQVALEQMLEDIHPVMSESNYARATNEIKNLSGGQLTTNGKSYVSSVTAQEIVSRFESLPAGTPADDVERLLLKYNLEFGWYGTPDRKRISAAIRNVRWTRHSFVKKDIIIILQFDAHRQLSDVKVQDGFTFL